VEGAEVKVLKGAEKIIAPVQAGIAF